MFSNQPKISEKRLRVSLESMRETLTEYGARLVHISGPRMLADALTKVDRMNNVLTEVLEEGRICLDDFDFSVSHLR